MAAPRRQKKKGRIEFDGKSPYPKLEADNELLGLKHKASGVITAEVRVHPETAPRLRQAVPPTAKVSLEARKDLVRLLVGGIWEFGGLGAALYCISTLAAIRTRETYSSSPDSHPRQAGVPYHLVSRWRVFCLEKTESSLRVDGGAISTECVPLHREYKTIRLNSSVTHQ